MFFSWEKRGSGKQKEIRILSTIWKSRWFSGRPQQFGSEYWGSNPFRMIFFKEKKFGRLGLITANKHFEMCNEIKYTKEFS